MYKNIFTDHPSEVDMTYLQHWRFAMMLARRTFGCSVGSFIHAFFPFMFKTHTSRTIHELDNIFDRRFEQQSKK
jgi:hypothetical protein